MPNIITNQFKISNAKSFIENFALSTGNSLYMFLAKPSIWSTESEFPPVPTNSQQLYSKLWHEIISLKKIPSTNMALVVPRINWGSGNIYEEYDNEDISLLGKQFYVLNSEFNVYKCIDNNRRAFSTSEPMGTPLNIFSAADGYKWKYLYTVSTSDRLKFLTDYWMPVRVNSDVAEVAKDGAIENIKIFNGGIDYSVRARVEIEGDGSGANIVAYQSLGVIYDVGFVNHGTGYRFAKAYIVDSNSNGRNANVKAILSPVGGHGSDPATELGAHYVMMNVKTEYLEGYGDFPGGFTYRKIGLIKNPKSSFNIVANVSSLSGLTGVSLSNINGTFQNNEFVEGLTSGANAYVVTANITAGNGYLKYVQVDDLTKNFNSFVQGETILGKVSGSTAEVANTIIAEVIRDTGEILYVENRYPVTRTSDQSDSLHLVIEF